MAWLKYLKDSETPGTTTPNTSYSYPLCKRLINKFTPKDTLPVGSWLFVDVNDININKHYGASLLLEEDHSSYLVVYENQSTDNSYTAVKCIINNGILFFQTAVEHLALEQISNNYVIYYNTTNLRKVNLVQNANLVDYQINANNAPYNINYSEVDLTTIEILPSSSYYYGFSYLNGWASGFTSMIGAKLYATFTGPNLYLYGNSGPNFGKFRYKIIGLPNKDYLQSSEEVSWQVIDCFSSENKDNQLLLEITNLRYRDYQLQLEVINDKNNLSTGNNVNIKSYSFTYNTYNAYEKELIDPSAVFVSSGSIK